VKKNLFKRNLVLGTLFFLPVAFLLFLYPSTHNYKPLDIVNQNLEDLDGFSSPTNDTITLKDYITVLGFLGTDPVENIIAVSNIKELVYDKFKGFKRFQIVFVVPNGAEDEVENLQKEVNRYEEVKFWHYVFGQPSDIQNLYDGLKSNTSLNTDLSTEDIFIIDKDLNQRGRLDDKEKKELETHQPKTPLYSYNCIDIGTIKNKMSDDLRVLFTEYRQKRKGDFDSSQRRAHEINQDYEQEN
jgi:hypothetical protein